MTTSELIFDPFSEDFVTDPHAVYARMRDETPVYYNEEYDFYALARHGSPGNATTADCRRALSVRYVGDDARFQPKEPNFMTNNGIPLPDLSEGAFLDHEMFPALSV